MNRRSFMTLASGLLVPWEPERVYSFLPAWRLVSRSSVEWVCSAKRVWVDSGAHFQSLGSVGFDERSLGYGHSSVAYLNPRRVLDILKSADAYGYPRPVIL